jgi:hypothetical protein
LMENSRTPFLHFYSPAIASEKVVVPVGADTPKKESFFISLRITPPLCRGLSRTSDLLC